MPTVETVLAYARQAAEDLTKDMVWNPSDTRRTNSGW